MTQKNCNVEFEKEKECKRHNYQLRITHVNSLANFYATFGRQTLSKRHRANLRTLWPPQCCHFERGISRQIPEISSIDA